MATKTKTKTTVNNQSTPKVDKVKALIHEVTNLCLLDTFTPEIALSYYPKNKTLACRILRHSPKHGTQTVVRVYGNSTASVLSKLATEVEKIKLSRKVI